MTRYFIIIIIIKKEQIKVTYFHKANKTRRPPTYLMRHRCMLSPAAKAGGGVSATAMFICLSVRLSLCRVSRAAAPERTGVTAVFPRENHLL